MTHFGPSPNTDHPHLPLLHSLISSSSFTFSLLPRKMAAANVPIPSSVQEAEQLISSFIVIGDSLQAGIFADYDTQYEALYQYGCTCEIAMSWVLSFLATRARVSDEPLIALQYLCALHYVVGKEPRARRSALRTVWLAMDSIAFQPPNQLDDRHLRSMARSILHILVDHRRENIIQDI